MKQFGLSFSTAVLLNNVREVSYYYPYYFETDKGQTEEIIRSNIQAYKKGDALIVEYGSEAHSIPLEPPLQSIQNAIVGSVF